MSNHTEDPDRAQPQSSLSSRRFIRPSRLARSALVLTLIAASAAAGGALGASVSGKPTTTLRVATATGQEGSRPQSPSRPPASTATGTTAGTPAPSSDPAAASDPAAFYAGRAMTGNGDTAITFSRAEQLADRTPKGATVEPSLNTIRVTASAVSLVVLASPPDHDMKFQIAGMVDPTIEVRQGTQTTLQFINGDSDMAHMLIIGPDLPVTPGTENQTQPAGSARSIIASARPLGDPTSAGQPAETITFTAPPPGDYWYYCAFPGHAAQGMRGRFLVKAR